MRGIKRGERYKAWGAMKSFLTNRGLGINVKCLYEGVIVPAALCGAEA